MKQAGERAVGLTRQLLAFSRKQLLQPVDLDPNQVLLDLQKMLRLDVERNFSRLALSMQYGFQMKAVWTQALHGQ